LSLDFRLIRTEKDYARALKRVEKLFEKNVKEGSAESSELDLLLLLVHDYESMHHAILPPDPIEAIRFRMDQMELKPKDLEKYLGPSGRVSEVLNGKRNLTLAMIRKLHKGLNIPAETLIMPSKTATQKRSTRASARQSEGPFRAVRHR